MSAPSDDFAAAIDDVCRLLDRSPSYVDEDGYDCTITAAVIDDAGRRFAWVEWRSKEVGRHWYDAYHLYAHIDDALVIRWEIETYNPYDGCRVGYLAWHDDAVVILYRDKHDSYLCALRADQPVSRLQISDDWWVRGETVLYRSEVEPRVERLTLPELEPLEPWPLEKARAEGMLVGGTGELEQAGVNGAGSLGLSSDGEGAEGEELGWPRPEVIGTEGGGARKVKWWQFWR